MVKEAEKRPNAPRTFALALFVGGLVACGAGGTGEATDGGGSPEASAADARADVEPDAAGRIRHDASEDAAEPALDAGVDAVTDAALPPRDAWTFAPTIPVAALDQNNTSACSDDAGPCSTAWDQTHVVKYADDGGTHTVKGFWDNAVAPGASAPGSVYGRVSKVKVSELLPGYDVPVWLAAQDWWGEQGHIDNGETSSSTAQVTNEVADQISRGFAGQVVAWDGPGRTEDKALAHIMTSAEGSGGVYRFAARFEKNYLDDSCGSAPTVSCLNTGLKYLVTTYGSSPAYLKDGSGRPIVFIFIDPSSADYALLSDPGVDLAGGVFQMLYPHGFPGNDPPNTGGEYAWVTPTDDDHATTKTTGSEGTFAWSTDFGFSTLTSFFKAASSNQSSFLVSSAYKGFDDALATWTLGRVIDQQCGRTWLETFDHTTTFGGGSFTGALNYLQSGKRLDMVMVDTWDDYEEGTEIETGIDNCLSTFDVSLVGSTLRWAPTWGADPMNAAITGTEATIFEYEVYVASPGSANVMKLVDVPCTAGSCEHSLDVSQLGIEGGPYTFYVQAIGQPSIANHLAGPTGTTFTAPR